MSPQLPRHMADDLIDYAATLLDRAGLDPDKARIVAEVLVEGDLLGHSTHGLALLPAYLTEIASGSMAPTGEPDVLSDRPATALWDGKRLPGPWLTWRACDEAAKRARVYGAGTVVIRRSHHIACLAAYLERIARQGLAVILECSDPSVTAVAPFGGTRPLFTPNPLAVGLPTGGDPILVDVSMSITTVGMTKRLQKTGERMPQPWLLDNQGKPTDDPNALDSDPRGSLLPLGGIDAGHKGYGLALMIEALTSGLGGYGRADGVTDWSASVFVQVLDPEAFGGLSAFNREMDHLVDGCRTNPPRVPDQPVRLPGEGGLRRKHEALANGVTLHLGLLDALAPHGEKLGVTAPKGLA